MIHDCKDKEDGKYIHNRNAVNIKKNENMFIIEILLSGSYKPMKIKKKMLGI